MSEKLPYGADPKDPSPDWKEGGHVHNWRNHVGENTKRMWSTFSPEQRKALILDADEEAGQEHWD